MKSETRELLVVEDDELVRMGMARVLAGAGYQVAVTGDMREAVAWLRARQPRLVISDVILPGPIHVGTLARMAAALGSPLILTSGLVRAERLAAQYAASAVLVKPFSGDELLAAVAGSLRAARDVAQPAGGLDSSATDEAEPSVSITDRSSPLEWTPSLA
jgi:DNA-binding response OmpR family regulator